MQWYYDAGGQQMGPVSDADLATLLSDGKINQATLVWRDGLPGWQPLATARPSGPPPVIGSLPGAACVECGRTFPPDQLVTLNRQSVCAECKPIFLQRMREGTSVPGSSGLWRQGKKIKTVSENPFPDRCVKCNAPANGYRLKRVFYWQHPAYLLLFFCSLLVLLIVMLIVRRKAVFHIGLCEIHRKQRQVAIAACLVGVFGGIALLCVAGVMHSGWTALAGAIAILIGAIWGIAKGRTLAPTKIDKEKNVWLSGAGKAFLDQLPESPN